MIRPLICIYRLTAWRLSTSHRNFFSAQESVNICLIPPYRIFGFFFFFLPALEKSADTVAHHYAKIYTAKFHSFAHYFGVVKDVHKDHHWEQAEVDFTNEQCVIVLLVFSDFVQLNDRLSMLTSMLGI